MNEKLVAFDINMDETTVVMRACKKEMQSLASMPRTPETIVETRALVSFLKKLGSQVFDGEDLKNVPGLD